MKSTKTATTANISLKSRKVAEMAPIQESALWNIFFVNGTPLKMIKQFKYLGRILSEDDKDDAAINNQKQPPNSM
jgi:hypothetical protein